MNTNHILKSIKIKMPYLQMHFGVKEIGLLGSFAGGEENTESALDLRIMFRNTAKN